TTTTTTTMQNHNADDSNSGALVGTPFASQSKKKRAGSHVQSDTKSEPTVSRRHRQLFQFENALDNTVMNFEDVMNVHKHMHQQALLPFTDWTRTQKSKKPHTEKDRKSAQDRANGTPIPLISHERDFDVPLPALTLPRRMALSGTQDQLDHSTPTTLPMQLSLPNQKLFDDADSLQHDNTNDLHQLPSQTLGGSTNDITHELQAQEIKASASTPQNLSNKKKRKKKKKKNGTETQEQIKKNDKTTQDHLEAVVLTGGKVLQENIKLQPALVCHVVLFFIFFFCLFVWYFSVFVFVYSVSRSFDFFFLFCFLVARHSVIEVFLEGKKSVTLLHLMCEWSNSSFLSLGSKLFFLHQRSFATNLIIFKTKVRHCAKKNFRIRKILEIEFQWNECFSKVNLLVLNKIQQF
ncbi:hypothetical protein RFI_05815, partial [Reticulomyxa filosa]